MNSSLDFNQAFLATVLPRYPYPRYGADFSLDHPASRYSLTNRDDYTGLIVYAIDPPGCQDADDAFSIWQSSTGQYFLAIHIADPTHFFGPKSDCFQAILDTGLTHYPSGSSPKHMMPEEVVQEASLMTKAGETSTHRRALSVITEFDPETYLPMGQVTVRPTWINCRPEYRWTYQQAVDHLYGGEEGHFHLSQVLNIAQALRQTRSGLGDKIRELDLMLPKADSNGNFHLTSDSKKVKEMKAMIAELAIFANSAVARFLQAHLRDDFIVFRHCQADDVSIAQEEFTPEQLMRQIISEGISADYVTQTAGHDLVGVASYCHFTSPIRRATDCLCHFLLKSIWLGENNPPFSQQFLVEQTRRLNQLAKAGQKIQHMDQKFRFCQSLANQLAYNCQGLQLQIRVSVLNQFVNVMIEKVNGRSVSISYSLRRPNYRFEQIFQQQPIRTLTIKQVNIPGLFDEGTLPEIDSFIDNPLSIESLSLPPIPTSSVTAPVFVPSC